MTIKLPWLQLIAQMEKSHDCYIFNRYFSSLYPNPMKHFRYLSKFDLESKSNIYSSQIDIPEVPVVHFKAYWNSWSLWSPHEPHCWQGPNMRRSVFFFKKIMVFSILPYIEILDVPDLHWSLIADKLQHEEGWNV